MSLPEPTQLPDGRWVARYSAPPGPDGKRRQPRVYGRTKKECTEALVAALGQVHAGTHVDDRRTKYGDHLDRRLRWWESEREIKPSTLASYREAADLYLIPALGHVRLVDLRDHHFRDLAAAMRLINRPEADADGSDLLRRLLAARATRDGRRTSTRPLTDARIRRVLAVASSSLADLVPHVLAVNPAAAVKVGKAARSSRCYGPRPASSGGRRRARFPARRHGLVRATQCGAFLDGIEDERLYSLYHVAAYFGLRRSELAGLCWADVDLATRRIHVRQAQVDDELDSTKSRGLRAHRHHRRGHGRRAAGVAQGRSSPSGWRGRAPGRTAGGCGPARTARRCGPSASPSGSTRWSPGSACRRSRFTACGTASATMAARRGRADQGHQRDARARHVGVHR